MARLSSCVGGWVGGSVLLGIVQMSPAAVREDGLLVVLSHALFECTGTHVRAREGAARSPATCFRTSARLCIARTAFHTSAALFRGIVSFGSSRRTCRTPPQPCLAPLQHSRGSTVSARTCLCGLKPHTPTAFTPRRLFPRKGLTVGLGLLQL